ncbi:unnamed protein product [Kluyveromyces dobzhanskii CBS 2104]|uniref:WGS project CCBQ000000000 data, contig 00058 n=1 Tax=Kluyveromyces dobzhanskii CBS 2104 TaxID=1427455 RepID=A0A0A8LBC7_9SACH|nr:unnamed protein product [Kluyveromyces dobzhanskii CBS 2104]
MSFSCQNCRKTRRKCDRGKPTCARCIKYKIDCLYELPPKHKIKQTVEIGNGNGTDRSLVNDERHDRVQQQQQQFQRPNDAYLPGLPQVPLMSQLPHKGSQSSPPFDLNFLQAPNGMQMSNSMPSGVVLTGGMGLGVSHPNGISPGVHLHSNSPVSISGSGSSSILSASSASENFPNGSRHHKISQLNYQHQQLNDSRSNSDNNNTIMDSTNYNSSSDTIRNHQPDELPHMTRIEDADIVHNSFAESDIKSRFETTNEFYSHVVKDPFCHYFLISQVLTGSKLIKLDPANSSLWFSCILEASNSLQPLSIEGVAESIGRERSNSSTKIIDDMICLLPPTERIRSLLSYFYTNVHGPYPILDVSRFEQLYEMIIEQRQYYYNLRTTMTFLATLIIALRLGYLSIYSFYTKFEPDHPTLKWCMQYPFTDEHLKCVSHAIHYLNDNDKIHVKTLILLRLMLLLDDDEKCLIFGWSDGELCKLINGIGVEVRNEDPNLWMVVCWNNLHYMLLCGAVNDQFDNSVFYNDSHLLDDSQTLEEIISLDDHGKLKLEVKHILKKGYQLFKLIISNRNLERTLPDDQFIQFKMNENSQLDLFKMTQPSYEFHTDQEQEVEIMPNVRINISIFNDYNNFKWSFFFKIKKLSNQSLLFFHFERTNSPLFWNHLLFTLTAAVQISKTFLTSIQKLRILKTPSRFVVSHVVSLVTNRTLAILFGLIIRFFYFQLNCRDQELSSLVREILLKIFSILKDIVNCSDISAYQPRTIAMANNMIQLFNMGKLELSLTSYLNSSKEDLEHYHNSTIQDSSWSSHVKLSPPSNLNTYSKMIMTMHTHNAKDVLSVLSLYDKTQPLDCF